MKRLIGLPGDRIAMEQGQLVINGEVVPRERTGKVFEDTTGRRFDVMQAGIGMAYLPPALAEPGTPLAVDIRGRHVPAEVVRRPFYRRPV